VVERRSFTLAAEDLALPRSTVTDAVKQLEARLGVRLLQRTTRHVSPTLDGEAYHRRCLALIADLEDAEAAFGGAKPKGLLRVDVHGTLARHFVLPRLPDFLAEYPAIEFYMSEGDRLVDLVRYSPRGPKVGPIPTMRQSHLRTRSRSRATYGGSALIDYSAATAQWRPTLSGSGGGRDG
jgi:DNA-binding transcriptional LysR family regulator